MTAAVHCEMLNCDLAAMREILQLHPAAGLTLVIEEPEALHALGEKLGALMADLWLDGKFNIP